MNTKNEKSFGLCNVDCTFNSFYRWASICELNFECQCHPNNFGLNVIVMNVESSNDKMGLPPSWSYMGEQGVIFQDALQGEGNK